jgi:polyisoprenoid-binding protein YceI
MRLRRSLVALPLVVLPLALLAVHPAAVEPRGRAALQPAAATLIDPARSHVGFTISKLGYSDVEGRFGDFDVDLRYEPERPSRSSVRWRVRVGSVETDAANRDRTLQSVEYFDAARHPELTFESRQVRAIDSGRLEVDGDITIKGRTRPLTITVHRTADGGGFETRFALDRYDFDVRGGRVMGPLIGRTVRVHLVAAVEGETR